MLDCLMQKLLLYLDIIKTTNYRTDYQTLREQLSYKVVFTFMPDLLTEWIMVTGLPVA